MDKAKVKVLHCLKCLIEIPFITITRKHNSDGLIVIVKCKIWDSDSELMLEDYLAIINNGNGNKQPQSISDTIEEYQRCNNDNKHKSNVAYVYCVICKKWLCNICFKTHKTCDSLKGHVLCQ